MLCCIGSGDTGAASFCHSWPHTSACVTGLQPLILVSAHSRHARHWSHHGINRVDCTAPRGPTNRQYSPVRLRPIVSVVSCTPPTTRPAPSCSLRGLVFCVVRTDQFLHLSSGEPPATSWIFPVLHCYTALVSINPLSRHARPWCCPSRAGPFSSHIFVSTTAREGCQGCGASPLLRNQMLRPRRAVRRRPVLWAERDANTKIPQRKDYIISKQNRLNAPGYIARTWTHYKQQRGPIPTINVTAVSVNCTKPIPNQTPMHLGRCHSCASQRHPDTMHNK